MELMLLGSFRLFLPLQNAKPMRSPETNTKKYVWTIFNFQTYIINLHIQSNYSNINLGVF